MAEYIEREAFIEAVKDIPMWGSVAAMIADAIPAADVAPVTYGEWIEDAYGYNHCSACGWEWDEPESVTPFCPNCGANMDGGEGDPLDAIAGEGSY